MEQGEKKALANRLKEIYQLKGESIFQDKRLFKACLKDFMPDIETKTENILDFALASNAFGIIRQESSSDVTAVVKAIAESMTDNYGIDSQAATDVLEAIAIMYGKKVVRKKTSAPSSSTSKESNKEAPVRSNSSTPVQKESTPPPPPPPPTATSTHSSKSNNNTITAFLTLVFVLFIALLIVVLVGTTKMVFNKAGIKFGESWRMLSDGDIIQSIGRSFREIFLMLKSIVLFVVNVVALVIGGGFWSNLFDGFFISGVFLNIIFYVLVITFFVLSFKLEDD